jgi:hypothetical protein
MQVCGRVVVPVRLCACAHGGRRGAAMAEAVRHPPSGGAAEPPRGRCLRP